MVQDLELRHCRALVALADHGGVTRAARALGVAQSTVSEALLALERIVGAPVAVRAAGSGTRLAPAGRALVPHARLLLSTADAALEAVSPAAPGARARVAVGAVESVSSYLLPAPVRELRARWPNAEVQVTTGMCDELRGGVAGGRLDVALLLVPSRPLGTETHPAGVRTVPLAPARLAAVVAPRDPLVGSSPTPDEVAARTILLSDPTGPFHALLRRWFDDGGARRGARLESAGSLDGVKRAVGLGEGMVGVLPAHAVRAELEAGTLAEIVPSLGLPALRLEAALPRRRPGSPQARQLLDALTRHDPDHRR